MQIHQYRGGAYTIAELSELSGIAPATIRDRLRRGYSVEKAIQFSPIHDSVEEFDDCSNWWDWDGLPVDTLHQIYWKWCLKNGYQPISKQGFSRQIMKMHPTLKIVPNRINQGDCCVYKRIIRMRKGDLL